MSSIFGKPSTSSNTSQSTNSSSASNQAYPMLSQALGGQVNTGTSANSGLASLLGVGGDPAAQQQAFSNFRDSTGYQFGMDQGTQAITGSAAAKGLLNSGATGKALESYGQNYANSQYQNYTNLLSGLTNSGNQAAGTISSAGNQSQSQGQSTGTGTATGAKQGLDPTKSAAGAFGFLGSIL